MPRRRKMTAHDARTMSLLMSDDVADLAQLTLADLEGLYRGMPLVAAGIWKNVQAS